MNEKFEAVFGSAPPALPLKDSGNIVQDNALRVDWSEVCPPNGDVQTFIVGNPPFHGARKQTAEQKSDLEFVFQGDPEFKDTDYVAGWFLKASDYISRHKGEFAFVATNSISQGEQVSYIWKRVLDRGQEISFAYSPFKWSNTARKNAGVYCVIAGVRHRCSGPKRIYSPSHERVVQNISPYLIEGSNTLAVRRKSPISGGLPNMVSGNMARDGGNLILSRAEKKLLEAHPEASKALRRLIGSNEFMNGLERWCLWIEDDDLPGLMSIPEITRRIDAVRKFRLKSKAKTTNGYASIPHKFAQRCHRVGDTIIIPKLAAIACGYLAVGFINEAFVVTDLAFAIYGAEPFVMALLSSRLHATWAGTVSGRLGMGLRYSANISYNTFPVPTLSVAQKSELSELAWTIVREREAHPGKTIAQLYHPETMPANLLGAHHDLDDTLERIYIGRPFKNDTERLEHLFKLYAATRKKKDAAKTAKKEAA
jgi:hypothetical protein